MWLRSLAPPLALHSFGCHAATRLTVSFSGEALFTAGGASRASFGAPLPPSNGGSAAVPSAAQAKPLVWKGKTITDTYQEQWECGRRHWSIRESCHLGGEVLFN
ncbi:unnamed protein product [Closterium sp. NIES-65]|nr:unnamed protein product [Closterium sp. NIES-65]